ncbi:MAG TPA: hypothetical protein VL987_13150 [Cellvibrio sp.]|nr:hypothetical protein [Cellvibrio sp.]
MSVFISAYIKNSKKIAPLFLNVCCPPPLQKVTTKSHNKRNTSVLSASQGKFVEFNKGINKMLWLQASIVIIFVIIHLFAGLLLDQPAIPRSKWLSFAGGVAVSYVFMHIFPELAAAQTTINESEPIFAWMEHHAYLVSLVGLIIFYGLERLVKSSRRDATRAFQTPSETQASRGVFWLHIGSFIIYNALIGYLLVHREEQEAWAMSFFAVAMGLHFVVNDFALRQDHKNTYHDLGRWLLTAAIVLGWVMGLMVKLPEPLIAVIFAFVAGGVVLNVLKEELPEENKSSFIAFGCGASSYAVLMLLF